MDALETYIATSRFGLGATAADWAAASRAPRRWLLDQLEGVRDPGPEVPASAASLAEFLALHAGMRRGKRNAAALGDYFEDIRGQVVAQLHDRLLYAVHTQTPFRERLVQFWANHFTVSRIGQPMISAACVGYEQEAIRAHLDGSFADMLLAVAQHPVMLGYLDNLQSMGPNSMAGRRLNRGLNENLARELLELHTLGVDGGYTQQDVTSLSRVITGWTVADGPRRRGAPGTFSYVTFMHEPGPQRVLGRSYPEDGVAQGTRVLRDLAAHPATARHIATKLVRHFIADEPPGPAVAAVEAVFRDTGGHLPSLHRALVERREAWTPGYRKFRAPQELVIAAARGVEPPRLPERALVGSLHVLNQVPFTAPSPAGWPDSMAEWAAPAALKARLEWGVQLGQRVGHTRDPRQLAERLLPPDAPSRTAVVRAESPGQALGLLFAGPDFQWRV